MHGSVHSSPFEDRDFAALFAKLRSPVASKVALKIVELASIRNSESLLDIGCGPGLISKSIMRRRVLKNALLIDRSIAMVASARRNLSGLDGKFEIMQVDLEQDNLDWAIGSRGPFDHVIAIDLWHLLEDRKKLSKFLLHRSLSSTGNLTIALHKEISKKRSQEWHKVRSEIREKISSKLKERYPDFDFGARSKGATVHKDEISLYLAELSKEGFKLSRHNEDRELADINQMMRHLPESFRIDVRRTLPGISDSLLKHAVDSSVKQVLSEHDGSKDLPIASEIFYVFERA